MHEQMDLAYHFIEKMVKDESEIDVCAQNALFEHLDSEHPRWTVLVLHAQQPTRSAVPINLHHSISDGLGLLFAFSPMIGVEGGNALATVPLPNTLLPPSARRAPKTPQKPVKMDTTWTAFLRRMLSAVVSFIRGALGPVVLSHDTELRVNEPIAKRTPFLPFSGHRTYTRFPPVPMAAVTAVQERHGCSMNDAAMAALAGALRRYAIEVNNDPVLTDGKRQVECKSMVMIGLPRKVDENKLTDALCNNILFASIPLPIDEPSAGGRLRRVVEGCNDLKSKPYMSGLIGFTRFFTGIAPRRLLNMAAAELFSKHTLLVTNVPSTSVEMTWPKEGGETVQGLSVVVANVMPQVSLVSYNGALYSNIVADPKLIPRPSTLGDLWVSEFETLVA